jgi:hypothetical protein
VVAGDVLRAQAVRVSLGVTYLTALLIRSVPGLSTGLPYNYDAWEALRVVSHTLRVGYFPYIPPHGPNFYSMMILLSSLLGVSEVDVFAYAMPFISSFSVLFTFMLARRVAGDSSSAVYSGLLAAVVGVFVHQTGICVPEALGLTYVALALPLLYDVMFTGGASKTLLLLITCGAILLTHHLTTFYTLLGLVILSVFVLASLRKFESRLLTPVYLTAMAALIVVGWWLFGVPGTTIFFFQMIFGATERLSALSFVLASGVVLYFALLVFQWNRVARPPSDMNMRGLVLRGGVISAAASVLVLSLVAFLVPLVSSYQLSPIHVLFFVAPYVFFVLFPAVIGLYFLFDRCRDSFRRSFSTVWCAAPVASSFFLLVASQWLLLGYRSLAFLLLGGFVLAGLGLAELVRAVNARWRLTQGYVLAYVCMLLAYTAFPPPSLLFGHNEAYTGSEVSAAGWACRFFDRGLVVDSDHRMGVLLRYTTGQRIVLGNETSWLGMVSQSGSLGGLQPAHGYVVVTESMLVYAVTGDWTTMPKPLPREAVVFLDGSNSFDRVFSSTAVTIYRNLRGVR